MAETNGGSAMSNQHWYWIAAGVALLVAVIAGLADRARHNRKNLDDTGWVPWRGIQVTAVFAVLVIMVLALKLA